MKRTFAPPEKSHNLRLPEPITPVDRISQIIRALLRAGWTIEQIRAHFPWLFTPGL